MINVFVVIGRAPRPGVQASHAGHPPGVAPEAFTEGPVQATRQGWPYYRRRLLTFHDAVVESRARCQATRQGWLYYIRSIHKRHDRIVYSRATPCGWPGQGRERRWSSLAGGLGRGRERRWLSLAGGLGRGLP